MFLFVGAIIFSFFLSRYITSSLRLIGEKLKAIKLNKENTKLIWSSNDEIGELVNQYNLMIDHVERSATLLAQSERESAWREMAKQVAHEIKNPLTPMKLNVQHLERSLNPNSDDFQERLALFSERMIRQIDSLAFIANEFSNFAKMPQAQFSQIDLLKKVEASIEIFKNEEYASIEFEKKMDKAIINGDKAQILRVFNNLLKNAIQSMDISKKGIIHVLITEEKGYYIVSIKDTGKGIPKENYDKIFVPNFTTKTSGSGLGLAMVKNIIENHKGQIWFESQVDKGTTFYMKFPMLNS